MPVEVPVAIVHEIEIKHVEGRTGERVERLIADLPQLPIVLDEPGNRRRAEAWKALPAGRTSARLVWADAAPPDAETLRAICCGAINRM
jgi:hypothetical protein